MKKKISSAIMLAVCVVVTLAAVSNVLVDNTEVMNQAEALVCEGSSKCPYAKIGMTRTPLGQTFTYTGKGKTIEVTCRRAAIAIGDYACEVSGK